MERLILERGGFAVVPCVATIGMFDGVHKGHRFVLSHVCDYAKEHGLASTVITFDKHPKEVVVTDWKPQLLTTFDERMRLLEETGIDRCVVLPFTQEMAAQSAYDFMRLMADRLGVKVLMTGYDNRFGHNRHDTFEDYVRYGEKIGIKVKGLPPAPSEERGGVVSSSMVRRLLGEGKVHEAADALTYSYRVTGKVVRGEHIGTHLGYPTANLQLTDESKLIPASGVYAVGVRVNGQWSMVKDYKGMMNIGTRPTFGEHAQTLEVHILDFKGDLYGKTITVAFIERLRDEQRFESEEELKRQLEEDKRRIEKSS
ncbi:MAG: bifunctional riboflavin kinase/FAD synthetase [Prevotella sp.]|nr:bifunctional riboflavin kinase/FAD synthetase [Prevotella sp.]MBQ8716084.1 bifunctional riboflavin kinase/FAD synthetase [Prevotella sp.]